MKHKVINQKDLPYQSKIMHASIKSKKKIFLYLKLYLFTIFYKIKIK